LKKILIDKKNEGKKLFRFIKLILPVLKNSDIFKIIRKKAVTVNNKREEPEYILKLNDCVEIYLKDHYFKKETDNKKFQSIKADLDIIYEDNDIIVVNKQRGIDTHASGKDYKNNLQEQVKAYLYSKGEYDTKDYFTPAPCHRLDRNTTGIIIFAKNFSSLKRINELFKERKAEKIYLALVCGKIEKRVLLV
jgi:23S rRNA pseudouridine955/2504/2580 synthase